MSRPLEPIARRLPRPAVNFVKWQVGRPISWHLDALATLWSTDKGAAWHGYARHYARHLHGSRRSIRAVLEIGIGGYERPRHGGQSLFMWRSYFPRATIYGLDLHPKRLESHGHIVVLQADQADAAQLRHAVRDCPPFDLIVDDGSHKGPDVINAFEVLFSYLKPGGIYAIEDVYYAYEPDYDGGPPGTRNTAIDLAKRLLDDLNLERRPVAAVHAYPGLVLVEKAPPPHSRRYRGRPWPTSSS